MIMEQLVDEIAALRRRLGDAVCIMGHHYQNDAVVAFCDVTGDSLELARRVPDIRARHIIFCGVHFMGESAALLASPQQSVHVPAPDADCEMARMAPAAQARAVLERLRALGRNVTPLAYVNTTLALKAVVREFGGAVCTSANAPAMLRWALEQGDGVLFLPDRNLGRNTARRLGIPEEDQHTLALDDRGLAAGEEANPGLRRRLLLWPGCCPIHDAIPADAVSRARAAHPGCIVAAHPECAPALIDACDGNGSTSYLIKEAERLAAEATPPVFVVGTEINLVNRLAARFADRCRIVPLAPEALCPDMAKITLRHLRDTLTAVENGSAAPLRVDPALAAPARATLDRMLRACS